MKTPIQWATVALCASVMWLGTATESPAKGKDGGKGKSAKKGKVDKPKGGKSKHDKKDFDKKSSKDLDKHLDKKFDKKADKLDDWKFGEADKKDVQNFYKKYADKDGGLPPGLAKKVKNGKPLPPGWKKKVKPGWQIDDEWFGRMNPLSSSDLPAGFKTSDGVGAYLLGDKILRVDKKSKKMLDYVDVPSIKL